MKICSRCDGTGHDGNCQVCGGSGFIDPTSRPYAGITLKVLTEPGADNVRLYIKSPTAGSIWDLPKPDVNFTGSPEHLITAKNAGNSKKPRSTVPHPTQKAPKSKKRHRQAITPRGTKSKSGPNQNLITVAPKPAPKEARKTDIEVAFERADQTQDGSRGWSAFRDAGTGQFGSYPAFDPSDDPDN